MKVYYHGDKARRGAVFSMHVRPGALAKYRDVAEFFQDAAEGKEPIQFKIEFFHGCAEVEQVMGRYLLEEKLAHKTALVLPRQELVGL